MTIPRWFHHVWIGNPMPARELQWSRTWREHHPDWRMTLWTDQPELMPTDGPWDEILVPRYINRHCTQMVRQLWTGNAGLAALSDLLRYEIVAQHGGVYADLDVECFQAIDSLLEGLQLGIADEQGPCNGNYLLAAVQNHPGMWTAVREAEMSLRGAIEKMAKEGKAPNPVFVTGPAYINKKLAPYMPVIWPWQLFNPLWAYIDHDAVDRWPVTAFGNHHFSGQWYSRRKQPPAGTFRIVAEDEVADPLGLITWPDRKPSPAPSEG